MVSIVLDLILNCNKLGAVEHALIDCNKYDEEQRD